MNKHLRRSLIGSLPLVLLPGCAGRELFGGTETSAWLYNYSGESQSVAVTVREGGTVIVDDTYELDDEGGVRLVDLSRVEYAFEIRYEDVTWEERYDLAEQYYDIFHIQLRADGVSTDIAVQD